MRKLKSSARKVNLLFAVELLDEEMRTVSKNYIGSLTHQAVTEAIGRARRRREPREINALRHAVRLRLIPHNPAADIPKAKPREKEIEFLTAEQGRKFLKAAKKKRLYALFAVALGTGMRQGEILALRWDTIDFEREQLKADGWHEYAANAAAAFTIGFLRSRPFPPEQAAGKAQAAPTLVMIAQSLRGISADELMPVLDEDAKSGQLEFLHLDFTDLVQNKVFTNPQAAAERVASPQGKLLGELARHADARLVFGGLAAIPPVVLAGHVVTARRPVRLFDFHERDWTWPGTPSGFPQLQQSALPKRPIKEAGAALIRMAISYPVTKADTDPVGLEARLQIDLSLAAPARFVVKSEEQVLDYGRAFRATLDGLRTVMPACQRVHLFYAGPMALAFHLGQQISENIHPPVTVWNFSRAYEWGIDLAAAVAGDPCVVRPAAATSADAREGK